MGRGGTAGTIAAADDVAENAVLDPFLLPRSKVAAAVAAFTDNASQLLMRGGAAPLTVAASAADSTVLHR